MPPLLDALGDATFTSCATWAHFGSLLDRFWQHFGSILEGFWNRFGPSWIDFERVTMTMAAKVLGLLGVGHIDFFVLLRDISRPSGLRGAIKLIKELVNQ